MRLNSEESDNKSDHKKIDMSIIDRIKQMRSQSRENGDVLLKKREDTIKQIQIQNPLDRVGLRVSCEVQSQRLE